jgi:hypothetical protein
MARKALQNDVLVKLIVGAGQASPSPPVGPALGSKGVKSMDFCKVRLETNIFVVDPRVFAPSPSPPLHSVLRQHKAFIANKDEATRMFKSVRTSKL